MGCWFWLALILKRGFFRAWRGVNLLLAAMPATMMHHGLTWCLRECLAPYLTEIGHGVIAQIGRLWSGKIGAPSSSLTPPPKTPWRGILARLLAFSGRLESPSFFGALLRVPQLRAIVIQELTVLNFIVRLPGRRIEIQPLWRQFSQVDRRFAEIILPCLRKGCLS